MIGPPQPTFLKNFAIFLCFDWSTLSYSIRTLTGDKEKPEKSPNCVLSSFFFEGGFFVQFARKMYFLETFVHSCKQKESV